jgi:RimJ/RimL family protein N-acetyltransferase
MTEADVQDLLGLVDDDAVRAFTLLPTDADEEWVRGWVARYREGWRDGSRAGFVARDANDGAFLGFAAIVRLDLAAGEGEIGYLTAPQARGRGVAARALALLTRWGLGALGLNRLELRIDTTNHISERVAERAGYRREGVLRSVHVKEGRRADVGVWSRLRDDGPLP